MSRFRQTVAFVLMFAIIAMVPLTISCRKKPATTVTPGTPPAPQLSIGDQIIHDAKAYGPVVAADLEEVIKEEEKQAAIKDATGRPMIDPVLENQIHQGLLDARILVQAFNEQVAKWGDHFDPRNKDDIDKFLANALAFVQKVYDQGVIRIADPQTQQIISAALSGAKVALMLWQSRVPQGAIQ